jgi:3-aminobutyryl-CoA ammonia-lyase
VSAGPDAPEPDADRPAAAGPVGVRVVHRRYVPYSAAHYAGGLVNGAYGLECIGDAATEVCIRTDGDEGLLAGYSEVRFLAPVRAGDVLEISTEVIAAGRRSRRLACEVRVICRGTPGRAESAAEVLAEPLPALTAVAVVVLPEERPPGRSAGDHLP